MMARREQSRGTHWRRSQGRCSASSSGCDCGGSHEAVIVNADDFGLTENVNREFWTLIARVFDQYDSPGNGWIRIRCSGGKRFHRLGIGVHLNLTEGTCATRVIFRSSGSRRPASSGPPALGRNCLASEPGRRLSRTPGASQEGHRAGIRPTHFDGISTSTFCRRLGNCHPACARVPHPGRALSCGANC